jgi:hypothetical protein
VSFRSAGTPGTLNRLSTLGSAGLTAAAIMRAAYDSEGFLLRNPEAWYCSVLRRGQGFHRRMGKCQSLNEKRLL